ncbi:2-oxoglutarate dehydrogenase E1 component [Entophlyctis luteolus]|nr:2-oxoglutarate dehydrogenase E1 component [Entophlyctis luteolus]KAJ3387113.1 2-oxoglutarate dehydrogenase E1 component [Entophlyctis sp. JEL0112]
MLRSRLRPRPHAPASTARVTARAAARALLPASIASRAFASDAANSSFLSGSSASYIEQMHDAWRADPLSVHASWRAYFANVEAGRFPAFVAPPAASSSVPLVPSAIEYVDQAADSKIPANEILDHMKVQLIVRAYQIRGHQLADLDPLQIASRDSSKAPELDPAHYGFTERDLDRKFFLGQGILPGFLASEGKEKLTLREIIDRLKKTYAGSIGIEYGHIDDRAACDWLRQRFEVPVRYSYSKDEKLVILDRLIWSDSFERFVATKYPSEKRFGLEGCESLIPGMKSLVDRSVELGVNSVVFGMPHRGRLNVLSNVVRKPNESIFCEFAGTRDESVEGSGDVKYHLGMNYSRPTPSGAIVNLSLAANPSHLECVNPVVQGKVHAIQFYQNDTKERAKALGVLLHGDAAFAGQGVVYEAMGLADLPSYTTGGTIHIVVNNQIGFTTDPRFSRSTPYCSDVAKVVSAPILHVNGDDVEAVIFSMQLAAEWRAKYKKDVVIDIVCYRKHGHNEIDQPGFTQPLMYERIKKMTPVAEKYIQQLLSEGTVSEMEVKLMKDRVWAILEKNYLDSKTYKPTPKEWIASDWANMKAPMELAAEGVPTMATGVPVEILQHVGIAASSYPSTFTVHPNLVRILKLREKTINEGDEIDWATAESMAFGTVLAEGNHVRLSGQDVERGTFSHRHALLNDQKTEERYVPLNNLVSAGKPVQSQSQFTVCNSSLTEFGCLGFELGYSMVNPHQLVMWEAQFGDFANNAQCIIDQFIASGEQKWLQRSGLTMLLPHGYDGQGPEHSSARIERYLQLCDQDPYTMPAFGIDRGSYARQHQECNMQVVYPSVPSNYFHALRRQVKREFRKPLIVFTSKALLRHPMAKSAIAEMGHGTRFQRLIPEVLHPNPLANFNPCPEDMAIWAGNNAEPRLPYALIQDNAYPAQIPPESPIPGSVVKNQEATPEFTLEAPNRIRTIIFCSGQVYYLLNRARAINNLRDIAIVRIEQLNPFPFHEVREVIDFYGGNGQGSLEEIVYCQEEAMNSGAWTFVQPRLETVVKASTWFTSGVGRAALEKYANNLVPGGLDNYYDNTKQKSIRGSSFVRYAGRDISAAPSTGLKKQHVFEEKMFVSEALLRGELRMPASMENGIPKF